MPTGDDLKQFSTNLNHTRSNVKDLRGKVDTMGDAVNTARQALEYAGKVEKQSDDFLDTLKSAKFSLKVMEKSGPMKLVAKGLDKVLDKLEDVTRHIRDKAHDIDEKIKKSGYIDKLKAMKSKLDGYEVKLYGTEKKLEDYKDKTDNTIKGFELIGAPADGVEGLADDIVRPLNTVLSDANALYDSIEAEIEGVGGFLNGFKPSLFQPMVNVAKAFSGINSSLEFLAKPLKAAYSALKPIEGLLDAVGFVYKITVGPVVDWIMDKLGITRIFEKVGDKIADLLPDMNILDKLLQGIDSAFAEVDDFLDTLGWNVEVDDFISKMIDDIFPDLDDSASGQIRYGSDDADTLVGRDGVDDILHPGAGSDVVQALGGDDIIMASAGDDTILGGAGTDRLIMGDSLLSYVFGQSGDGAAMEFFHVGGKYGRETVYDVELFVFDNGTLTGQELRENVHSLNGGMKTGTDANEFFYAITGSPAVTIDGAGGNDDITGSEFADMLFGGEGNDRIASMRGADTVDGGAGIDTWVYPLNNAPGNSLTQVDLITGQTWDGDSRDTLISIENIAVEDDRDTDLFGDNGANVITSSGGRDWIDGRGGDDSIEGGAGRDLLIGGSGVDTVRGGDGSDKLVAGGHAVLGRGEYYDGGDGTDTLIYSNDYSEYDIEPRDFVQIASQEPTGQVRIDAGTGKIERLSADGARVLATDKAENIEVFIGSDQNDTIYGAQARSGEQLTIDGGGGDDILYSRGARWTNGGKGDDMMFVVGGGSFDGGDGIDTLDTRMEDARWFIRLTGAIGTTIQAFKVDESETFTDESGNAKPLDSTRLFSGNLMSTEIVYLGKYDDEVRLEGDENMTFYGGDGNDRLIRSNSTDGTGYGYMHGQAGDDYLELRTSGALYGGIGDDELFVQASGGDNGHTVVGGDGDDLIRISRIGTSRTDAEVDGGAGYDAVVVNQVDYSSESNERTELNLRTGVFQSFSTNRFGESVRDINALVSNVEEVVGAEVKDLITGRDADERLLGRGGNDTIEGRGGRDEIFGGDGNDLLQGGLGNDLLHGGPGNDTLDGGDGRDTASYSNAFLTGAFGEVSAGDFGTVQADLMTGVATHANGTDRLINVENVTGGKSGDRLSGDDQSNALSGGDGDDTLIGRGGDDVLVLGVGNDSAEGGDGDDTFILDRGDATIRGGAGYDTLDLGNLLGSSQFSLSDGTYSVTLTHDRPVWNDTGTTEARLFGSTVLTPLKVSEADPIFSNSFDDLTRVLPDSGSAEALTFAIKYVPVSQIYSITMESIEAIIGGVGNDTIVGSSQNDTLQGGGGNDSLQGAAGVDVAKYTANVFSMRVTDAQNGIRVHSAEGSDFIANDVEQFAFENASLSMAAMRARIGQGMTGSAAGDNMTGSALADRLRGFQGNDTIEGGAGFDTIEAGAGHDTVAGGDGRDKSYLGEGNDRYSDNDQGGTLGQDTVFGGAGQDTIQGGGGNDAFFGELGDDEIHGRLGDDKLYGGDGFDTLYGGDGNDRAWGGNGRDKVFLGNGNDAFYDTSQGGTLGQDTVFAGAGNDTIEGGAGNDVFFGELGNDVIRARLGNDKLYGGDGFDTLDGGDGNDSIWGGNGRDKVFLGNGNDVFFDNSQGGTLGQDTVFGGAGFDTVNGGAGNDVFYGNKGNDRLFGANGDDRLYGGDNADMLYGGNGADSLWGGNGIDQIWGGAGLDTFFFADGFGTDTVFGFDAADGEKVSLVGVTAITDFADLITNHLVNVGGTARIVDGSNFIQLNGVAFADVGIGLAYSADDFIF